MRACLRSGKFRQPGGSNIRLGRGLMRAAACCLRGGGCQPVSVGLVKENPARGFMRGLAGGLPGRSHMRRAASRCPPSGAGGTTSRR